jgi:hypothetical protein
MLIGKYYDCGAFFFVTDFTDIYVWAALLFEAFLGAEISVGS